MFRDSDAVEQYIKNQENLIPAVQSGDMMISTIIIPSNIEYLLIDTSDDEKLSWMKEFEGEPIDGGSYYFLPYYEPFEQGIMYKNAIDNFSYEVKIHRNGCIQNIQCHKNCNTFPRIRVKERLVHTLQFGETVLRHYGYNGKVRIRVKISAPSDVMLHVNDFNSYANGIERAIDRIHPVQYVSTNYLAIAQSIMDDVSSRWK